jgi:hypothetical protein
MGRQFRFYLSPSDIERIIKMLREEFGARFLSHAGPSSAPVDAGTIFRTSEEGIMSVDLNITMPGNASVRTWYAEKRKEWLIDSDSEVIEFSGCYFQGSVLQIGRFYYQTNFVVGNEFRDKSSAFVRWAEQVFRATKKDLTYSPKMMAYVGEDAMRWRKDGGRFASLRRADGTYLYESD